MNWLKDVAMLFGEWLLIMLIPLMLGVVIGWLLWYRKWRKAHTEKDAISKELNRSRNEVDSIALSRSEELEALRLKLEKTRTEYDEKLLDKSNELEQWKSDYEECHNDNETLDLTYKDEIGLLKARITELDAEGLKVHTLETELIDLRADREKEASKSSAEIEALKSELSAKMDDLQQLEALTEASQQAQASLTESQEKVLKLQDDLEASSSTVVRLEAELADSQGSLKSLDAALEACKAEKAILISASGQQMTLDIDLPEELSKEQADQAFNQHLEAASKGINLDYEDDLKEINGVGPKMEKLLKAFGVQTFYQLSKFDDQGVAALNAKLDGFPGRIQRDNWVGQAKELHEVHHDS